MRTVRLDEGWQLASAAPGAIVDPAGLAGAALAWRAAEVPGTVASSLGHDLALPGPFDASDWWYRVTFANELGPRRSLPPSACAGGGGNKVSLLRGGDKLFLRFDGLATIATAWLNGERILESRNMFRGHRVEVTALLRDVNHLVIRFASLAAALAERRPRPRWRTALVEHQNLRWHRTTLLGRMPGWTPPIDPVGPWQPVALECVETVDVCSLNLQARAEGSTGRVQVRAAVTLAGALTLTGARLRVGDTEHPLHMVQGHDARLHGDLTIKDVPLWWPHTHGEPRLVPWALELRLDDHWVAVDSGRLGFKDLALDTTGGDVRLAINGAPVFCRGACWTPPDFLRLRAEPGALRAALEAVRDAGGNMLRVGGTMAYESDDFYRLCDELGILVWQDFMFANMDYPIDDAAFRADAEAEVRHQLARLHRHPCIAAYCGGSEVAQQAAMLGLPPNAWSNELFTEALPRLASIEHAGIPYFPSTPWGGALPFHVGSGIAHYYGVGAYRRPLADAKSARVKFATECLAFSNVPEPETMALVMDGALPPPHHPRWKARVPRDHGSGWDFEDIRDHYVKALFGIDPVELRGRDLERYYAVGRAATGEAMRRVFAEWRAPASGCGGGLVWLLRDLWPGAGWGVVDSTGRAKAALWHLRRAWAPQTVHLTDEGLDGYAIHVVNDRPETLEATVKLELLRDGRIAIGSATRTLRLAPHSATTLSADALLGSFTDATNAYRFGPAKFDVVAVRLTRTGSDEVLGEDFMFPTGMDLPRAAGRVEARAQSLADGRVQVRMTSETFLQAVSVASDGYQPDDNHFHVAPQREKVITFRPVGEARAFRASFEALNRAGTVGVRLPSSAGSRSTSERLA